MLTMRGLRACLRSPPNGVVNRVALPILGFPKFPFNIELREMPFDEFDKLVCERFVPDCNPDDIQRLEDNVQLLSVMRSTYITSRFRTPMVKQKYMKGLPSFLYNRVKERTYLPSFAEVAETFDINPPVGEDWRPYNGVHEHYLALRDQLANSPGEFEWNSTNVIEAANGEVKGMSFYNVFCEEQSYWEMLTAEAVVALVDYLLDEVTELLRTRNRVTILEVGSGDGRLAFFIDRLLKASLLKEAKRIDYVASDDRSWPSASHPVTRTHQLSYERAVETFRPDVVVCSWMPNNTDWTAVFRAMPTVQQYILMGESDFGGCGMPWETFGHATKGESGPPPFILDGFSRHNLDEVSRHQLNRYDGEGKWGNSRTIAFKRNASTRSIRPGVAT